MKKVLVLFTALTFLSTAKDKEISELSKVKLENIQLKLSALQKEYQTAINALEVQYKTVLIAECTANKITNCDDYTINPQTAELVQKQKEVKVEDIKKEADKQKELNKPIAPPKN